MTCFGFAIAANPADQVPDFITDDIALAQKQAVDYPENIDAHFNLAVAYSRSIQAEKALDELKLTKKLIRKSGNPKIVDESINKYNELLTKSTKPREQIIYRLAFMNYLKAYYEKKLREKAWNKELSDIRAQIKPLKKFLANSQLTDASGAKIPEDQAKSAFDPKQIEAMQLELKTLRESRAPIKRSLSESSLDGKLVQKSVDYLDLYIKNKPKDIWANSYKGFMVYEQSQDIDKAKVVFDKAISLDPKNPTTHFLFGQALMQAGKLDQGLKEVASAVFLKAELEAKAKTKAK